MWLLERKHNFLGSQKLWINMASTEPYLHDEKHLSKNIPSAIQTIWIHMNTEQSQYCPQSKLHAWLTPKVHKYVPSLFPSVNLSNYLKKKKYLEKKKKNKQKTPNAKQEHCGYAL